MSNTQNIFNLTMNKIKIATDQPIDQEYLIELINAMSECFKEIYIVCANSFVEKNMTDTKEFSIDETIAAYSKCAYIDRITIEEMRICYSKIGALKNVPNFDQFKSLCRTPINYEVECNKMITQENERESNKDNDYRSVHDKFLFNVRVELCKNIKWFDFKQKAQKEIDDVFKNAYDKVKSMDESTLIEIPAPMVRLASPKEIIDNEWVKCLLEALKMYLAAQTVAELKNAIEAEIGLLNFKNMPIKDNLEKLQYLSRFDDTRVLTKSERLELACLHKKGFKKAAQTHQSDAFEEKDDEENTFKSFGDIGNGILSKGIH